MVTYENKIVHDDCLRVLDKLDENSVGAVITDPPYNIANDFELMKDNTVDWSHDFGEWDEDEMFPHDWLSKVKRVLKDNAVVIAMYDNIEIGIMVQAMRDADLNIRQKMYWHKQNPHPQIHKIRLQDAIEEMVVATMNEGAGHPFNGDLPQRHNVVETPICQGKERLEHPTQKPEDLFRPIIDYWTQEDTLILDPFTGSGTIPTVAKKLGRPFIGIEAEEEYHAIAEQRVRQTGIERGENVLDF
jgi:DNA modification methylase